MSAFIPEPQTAEQLSDRVIFLESTLRDLVEEIDCLYGIEYSRDTEPHKAEYCWNYALDKAREALLPKDEGRPVEGIRAIVYESSTDVFPSDEQTVSICKRGQGADCCAWLTVDSRGFVCRNLNKPFSLLDAVDEGRTSAKRRGCRSVNEFSALGMDGEVYIPIIEATA